MNLTASFLLAISLCFCIFKLADCVDKVNSYHPPGIRKKSVGKAKKSKEKDKELKYWYNYYFYPDIPPTSKPTASPSPRPTSVPTSYPTPSPMRFVPQPSQKPNVQPLSISAGGSAGIFFAFLMYVGSISCTIYVYYIGKAIGLESMSFSLIIKHFSNSKPMSSRSDSDVESTQSEEELVTISPPNNGFFRRNPFQRQSNFSNSSSNSSSGSSYRDTFHMGVSSLYSTVFRSSEVSNRNAPSGPDPPVATQSINNSASRMNNWSRKLFTKNPFRRNAGSSSEAADTPAPYYRDSLTQGTQAL